MTGDSASARASDGSHRGRAHHGPAATLLALAAVGMWSSLGLLGARVSARPPLLVAGVALCVGGLLGALRPRVWHVPARTLAIGVIGMFDYHFLYFTALHLAPPVEANLVNYLWPCLVVLLSPVFLSGHPLRPHHIVGALMSFTGAALIVTGGRVSFHPESSLGYFAAALGALVWASYSLLTKRVPPFPTGTVGAFCLTAGLLSLATFRLQGGSLREVTALATADWASLVLLGIGPMGLAFFAWDASLKRGDPRVIGSLAFITPLTATALLVLAGGHALSWVTAVAGLLIITGSVIGSLEVLRKSPPESRRTPDVGERR